MDTLGDFDPNAIVKVKEQIGTNVKRFRVYEDILTPDEQAQALEIAEKFDPFENPASVSGFGANPMNVIAGYSTPILDAVRMRSLGPMMKTVKDALALVDSIDFDAPFKDPPIIARLIKTLDPWVAWLKSLSSLEKNIQKYEVDLQRGSQLMLQRAIWFFQMRSGLSILAPSLYLYAAAGEKIVDREQLVLKIMIDAFNDRDGFPAKVEAQKALIGDGQGDKEFDRLVLNIMEKVLKECKGPSFQVSIMEHNRVGDRLQGRVMDLHEQALFAMYMQPVMLQSEYAAMTAFDSAMKGLNQTFPKLRIALAVLIAQQDIQDVQEQANSIEEADAKLMGRLAGSLGKTNETVLSAYEVRRQKVEEVKSLVNQVLEQIHRAVEIDQQISQMYSETLDLYGTITASLRASS